MVVRGDSPAAGVSASATSAAASGGWVEAALGGLSLRAKVAQLVMPRISGAYAAHDSAEFDQLREWVAVEGIGGVVISVGTPLAYAAKLNELQRISALPLFVTSDMENGPGMRLGGIFSLPHLLPQGGGTIFPPLMALGATSSESLARELGQVLGAEARAVGVHLTFGPVLDVNSNPENPIINTRAFGASPELVGRLAAAYIEGAREAGLMTAGKHFPGHGDAHQDSHLALPTITADRARLDEVELPPFRAAIRAGVDAIMTAHIAMIGIEGAAAPPATLSPHFMSKVLRQEMGFDGLLFTDAMTMAGISRHYGAEESLVLALEAGADILLMPEDVGRAIDAVTAAVEGGRLTEARIDASVRRVLAAKARAGLAHERRVDLDRVAERVGTRRHAQIARTIAERSITLVRDVDFLVPLPSAARRILSITYAATTEFVAGRAFDAALATDGAAVTSVRVDDRSSAAEVEAVMERLAEVDIVIASAYLAPIVEAEGGIAAGRVFRDVLGALRSRGVPLVLVSFGTPYLLNLMPDAPAYLLAWGGAEVSQRAAAAALLGQTAITGTLPVPLPPHHALGAGIPRIPSTKRGR